MKFVFENKKEVILIVIILICLVFFIFQNITFLTGNVTEGSIPSNVSVAKYLAVTFGSNLANGIQFGSVSFLPATDVNATHNYDGTNNATTFYIEVSNDSNSAVDFCIKADTDLTSPSLDVIGVGNETYSNSTSTNITEPGVSSQTSLTTVYTKSSVNVNIGSSDFWRFWLDVPTAQPSGDYNNTVYFKGIVVGASC